MHQHRLGEQLLQSAVLVLQRVQLAGIGDLHPAIARTPIVERRIADAVLCGTHHRPIGRQRVPSAL